MVLDEGTTMSFRENKFEASSTHNENPSLRVLESYYFPLPPWKLTYPDHIPPKKNDGWKMKFPFEMVSFLGTCKFPGVPISNSTCPPISSRVLPSHLICLQFVCGSCSLKLRPWGNAVVRWELLSMVDSWHSSSWDCKKAVYRNK